MTKKLLFGLLVIMAFFTYGQDFMPYVKDFVIIGGIVILGYDMFVAPHVKKSRTQKDEEAK